ncbi:hypothetical protein ACHAPM_007740 [Fusarium culmorum]
MSVWASVNPVSKPKFLAYAHLSFPQNVIIAMNRGWIAASSRTRKIDERKRRSPVPSAYATTYIATIRKPAKVDVKVVSVLVYLVFEDEGTVASAKAAPPPKSVGATITRTMSRRALVKIVGEKCQPNYSEHMKKGAAANAPTVRRWE